MVDDSERSSVRVSWQPVEGADYYKVSFRAAVGADQEGLCRDDSHSASLTVDAYTATIAVEEDVETDESSILRAYTTYLITVEAFCDTDDMVSRSTSIKFTTQQLRMSSTVVLHIFSTLFCAGSLSVPHNITGRAQYSSVILVKWSGIAPCRLVNGVIIKYRVQYRAESDRLVKSKEVAGNWSSGAETELIGLTPSTNYSIAVAAVNNEGITGVFSDPVFIKTLSGRSRAVALLMYSILVYLCKGQHPSREYVVFIIIGASVVFVIATIGILIFCLSLR